MDSATGIIASLIGAMLLRESIPPVNATISNWIWLIIYAFIQVIDVGLVVYGFKNLEA